MHGLIGGEAAGDLGQRPVAERRDDAEIGVRRAALEARGCTLVDTTCGSVLNVWKNVRRYAEDGFTSIIHGKVKHEETQATASQAIQFPDGHFLVVLDEAEAEVVCDYIRHGGDRAAFLARFGAAASPGFDPDRHLARVGCANQTTMLMSESLAVGERFRAAMRDRYGEAELASRFRAFDTICSATQERQDAVIDMLTRERLDLIDFDEWKAALSQEAPRARPTRLRRLNMALLKQDVYVALERRRRRAQIAARHALGLR